MYSLLIWLTARFHSSCSTEWASCAAKAIYTRAWTWNSWTIKFPWSNNNNHSNWQMLPVFYAWLIVDHVCSRRLFYFICRQVSIHANEWKYDVVCKVISRYASCILYCFISVQLIQTISQRIFLEIFTHENTRRICDVRDVNFWWFWMGCSGKTHRIRNPLHLFVIEELSLYTFCFILFNNEFC